MELPNVLSEAMPINRYTLRIVVAAVVAILVVLLLPSDPEQAPSALQEAINSQVSDVQVQGKGAIVKVLPDDLDGSKHQRLILRTEGGDTILIAHNIDLAPRIPDPQVGDIVEFYGEYEWNEKGGVVHWTHHDPAGRHPGGRLEHQGRTYE